MKKYLIVKVLIISFVFFLSPTIQAASDWEDSIESYKQATRINPDDADAHFNLGGVYGKSGMYKEAIEAYKQAIRIDTDFAQAHYNLGIVYVHFYERDSALEQYKTLKSLNAELANKLFDSIYE